MDGNIDLTGKNRWTKNGFGETVDNKGTFTKAESDKVRHAIKEYCASRQITPVQLCSECDSKPEYRGCWAEIAQQVPERCVGSVYRHGLRMFHSWKRGNWTTEEVSTLFDLVTKHGKKWTTIQKILGRSADACRDKYREHAQVYIKGRWKQEEIDLLKKHIREHIKAEPNATMIDMGKIVAAQNIQLPWEAIASKMGNRSRLSCYKKWQKMTGLFSPSDAGKRKVQSEENAATLDANGNRILVNNQHQRKRKKPSKAAKREEDDDDAPVTELDTDMELLQELAASGAYQKSEVPWDTLHVEDALERWNSLVVEWQEQEGEEAIDNIMTSRAFCEQAQMLLERKKSAKMAAETVEAVDLPTVI